MKHIIQLCYLHPTKWKITWISKIICNAKTIRSIILFSCNFWTILTWLKIHHWYKTIKSCNIMVINATWNNNNNFTVKNVSHIKYIVYYMPSINKLVCKTVNCHIWLRPSCGLLGQTWKLILDWSKHTSLTNPAIALIIKQRT